MRRQTSVSPSVNGTYARRSATARATRRRQKSGPTASEESPMRKGLILAAAALVAAPLAARAESEVSVVVQGGGVQYNQALAGQTDFGVAYGARVAVMPTPIVGFEVGYLGSQNNVKQ